MRRLSIRMMLLGLVLALAACESDRSVNGGGSEHGGGIFGRINVPLKF
jgi:hypothetical protein